MSKNRQHDLLLEKMNERPWKERIRSFNYIKHYYTDRGIPAEQFLEDRKDLVEKYNITKEDLDYVVELIKKYGAES